MSPQAPEQGGQAGASAHGNNPERRRLPLERLIVRISLAGLWNIRLRWPTSGHGMLVPALRKFRIQQLCEAGVIDHALEVIVRSCLKPVLGIELDGLRQAV